MKLFKIAALSSAAFSLALVSACTPTSLDAKIQASLPKICQDASVLYAAYEAASPTINEKTNVKVDAAYDALFASDGTSGICQSPSSATAATILVDAARAYASFTLALKNAK